MASPAEDMLALLDAEPSLGLTDGTNLFLDGFVENAPHKSVAVYDSGANSGPEFDQSTRLSRVQVTVRGDKGLYSPAYQLADDIVAVLQAVANHETGGLRYSGVQLLSGPNRMPKDREERPRVSCNFYMVRGGA